MIFGPVGNERLDVNFAYVKEILHKNVFTETPPVNDFILKWDWRNHFPKSDEEAIYAAVVENVEKDKAFLENRFGGQKQQATPPHHS